LVDGGDGDAVVDGDVDFVFGDFEDTAEAVFSDEQAGGLGGREQSEEQERAEQGVPEVVEGLSFHGFLSCYSDSGIAVRKLHSQEPCQVRLAAWDLF